MANLRSAAVTMLLAFAVSCADSDDDPAEGVGPPAQSELLVSSSALTCANPAKGDAGPLAEGELAVEIPPIRRLVDASGTMRYLVFPMTDGRGQRVYSFTEETDSGSIYTVYRPAQRILSVENMETYERWHLTGSEAVSHPRAAYATEIGEFAKRECDG